MDISLKIIMFFHEEIWRGSRFQGGDGSSSFVIV